MDESVARQEVAKVRDWIHESEVWVDQECLNLYAGTNRQSEAVRAALASTLNARPSLGDPGDKYETGLAFSDLIEKWVDEHLRRLLNAAHVEYRVLSGSMANLYAYMASTQPGDTIYAMPDELAGHATHHQNGAAGLYGLNVVPIPYHKGTHLIDWEAWYADITHVRPALVIMGTSLPLLPVDIGRASELVNDVGGVLMYDAAHVAGLVVSGRFQRPLAEGASLLTMSTYKTFGGPPGGIVATNNRHLAERVKAVAYPGMTANFDMARVAGLGVSALEQETYGDAYAAQCIENARALAEALMLSDIPVWLPNGHVPTESHLVAIDAHKFGGGTRAARLAELSNVLFSGIPLPIEAIVGDYNGIRLGTQELTRIGMTESHMGDVARFLKLALERPERADVTRKEVSEWRADFRTVHFGLDVQ